MNTFWVLLITFVGAMAYGMGRSLGEKIVDISAKKIDTHKKRIIVFFKTFLFVTLYSLFWGTLVAGAIALFALSIIKANAYASTTINPILKWFIANSPFIFIAVIYLIGMTIWMMKDEGKKKEVK